MGDLGDYWNDHKEHKKALRSFWNECPQCKVAFGTASLVPPGRKCRHHDFVSLGNVGDDKKALKIKWDEDRANKRLKGTTMQMIEKVARALPQHIQAFSFDDLPRDATQLREWTREGKLGFDCNSLTQADFLELAEVAIGVMREPTKDMGIAGFMQNARDGSNKRTPERTYQAMIDAALVNKSKSDGGKTDD